MIYAFSNSKMYSSSALWDEPFSLNFEDDFMKELNTLPSLYEQNDLNFDFIDEPTISTSKAEGFYKHL